MLGIGCVVYLDDQAGITIFSLQLNLEWRRNFFPSIGQGQK